MSEQTRNKLEEWYKSLPENIDEDRRWSVSPSELEEFIESMNTHKEELSNCCSAKPCGEIAYDNSGRCGDCKEGCMFEVEPTPPSQIEEEPIYRLIMLWHDYNKHCYSGGTERSPVTFEEFITSSWLLNQLNNTK